jgi:hypothetical protein
VNLIPPQLQQAKRVLLAGCGGGYDVFGAVPLLAQLKCEVFLSNVSFCVLPKLPKARQIFTNLYEVTGESASEDVYCPEAWLSKFLQRPIFAFDKTGVQPLRAGFEYLLNQLQIDALVLIDGGIDSLLRGDESSLGTPDEDLATLAACHDLPVATKLLSCVGFGAELRDGICHEQVFDRIAALTRDGGYVGTSTLLANTDAGKFYREAVEFTFAHQQQTRRSHIHDVVLASMLGEYTAAPRKGEMKFDRRGPHVWISPLMNLYWHFDLAAVARANLLLPHVLETQTIWDVTVQIEAIRKVIPVRDRTRIPI